MKTGNQAGSANDNDTRYLDERIKHLFNTLTDEEKGAFISEFAAAISAKEK